MQYLECICFNHSIFYSSSDDLVQWLWWCDYRYVSDVIINEEL